MFGELINEKVVVYMDDITVYSKSHDEVHRDGREVLQLLLRNGLRINRDKCRFCTNRINLLGFTVMEGEVLPDEERLGPFKT